MIKTYTLADAATGTGTSGTGIEEAHVESYRPGAVGLLQFKITGGEGAVNVQGSLNGTDWVDLIENDVTEDSALQVALFPNMRVDIGTNPGTVTVLLSA